MWASEYLELRLAQGAEQVDYLCALRREGASAAFSTGLGWEDQRLSPHRRLLKSWSEEGSILASGVPFVWLEFDDTHCLFASHPRIPSLSVCLVPNYRPERELVDGVRPRHLRIAREVLSLLLDFESARRHEQTLAECFTCLPSRSRWIHLSVMLGRAANDVKLYGVLRRDDVVHFLEQIGWQGDLGALRAMLVGPYAEDLVGDEVYLDLNLQNFRSRENATLGLAVSRQHAARGPHKAFTQTRSLENWAHHGLVSQEKAERCRRWAEQDRCFLDLKLVWQASAGVSAKAYLGRALGPS